MNPEFITFTGVDDETSIDGMIVLAKKYPIEWGVLISRSRQGEDPRYPSVEKMQELLFSEKVDLVKGYPLRLAGHICGQFAREIMDGVQLFPNEPIAVECFDRLQINHSDPKPQVVAEFQMWNGVQCILQTRSGEFPSYNNSVQWLFDPSGGAGKAPTAWPKYPFRKVGYAGGINPDNVRTVINQIDANGAYWIDMESGVRTDNKFDLDLCRQVCEAVYGVRQ